MKKIFYLILAISIVSCVGNHKKKAHGETYATTDRPGYCYHGNDGLWYLYYLNSTGNGYTYAGTSQNFTSYNSSEPVSWSPTSENVSNFEAVPEAVAESMTEASGDATGGTEATESADGSMSEADGSSEGGSSSDGGSSDSGGGGDSGGGDGGGGGD
jgi:uncharacterized membrane protein YgcG